MVVARRRAREDGFTLIEGTATWAEPAGIVSRAAYETLRDEILAEVRAALPLDVVILGLHGAMVAHGYDDCEGDFLRRIRAIVGPDAVIAAEFDPHSHLTQQRLDALDILVMFKEVPHTDFADRAEEVVDLALRMARQEIAPHVAVFDCRMLEMLPTSRQPMRGYRRPHQGAGGQGRRALDLGGARLLGRRRARTPARKIIVITDNRPEIGRSGSPATSAWSCSRSAARPGIPISRSTTRSTPRSPSRAGRWC